MATRLRKPPARGFRNPPRLASNRRARHLLSEASNPTSDAARCVIRVTTRAPHFPIEFEFSVLKAILVAPRCLLPIIFSNFLELRAEKNIQPFATEELK